MRYTSLALIGLIGVVSCSEPPSRPDPGDLELSRRALADSLRDYVFTPAGVMIHRTCIHEVPDGATMDQQALVTRRDGSRYQLPSCRYPVRTRDGRRLTDQGVGAQVFSNWDLYGTTQSAGVKYHKVTANWNVPASPTAAYTDQIYYTFPGIQKLSPGAVILQPVLQYGYNGFGGSFWTLSSWQCFAQGGPPCTHSTPITVTAGNTLHGSVVASNCSGGNCTWTVTGENVTTGQSTTHVVSGPDNYNLGVGAAVETYQFAVCNHYPVNGVLYSNISLFNASMTQVYPTWTREITPGLSPSCGFSTASPYSSSIKLYHNPAPAPSISTLTTNPSPAKQYTPFTATINGSGFNPANAEAVITGPAGSGCNPNPCYFLNNQWSTKTSTQLIATGVVFSIPSTLTLRIRNGDGGSQSNSKNFIVDPLYP